MIRQSRLETQKSNEFRIKANKWIQKYQNKDCSEFMRLAFRLGQIYKLLIERNFNKIQQQYDIDYEGYLEVKCHHKSSGNWNFNLCLPPFEINIEDCMGKETCKDILTRIQHSDTSNKFSWSKPMQNISPKIFVSNGNFSNKLDNYTTVSGRQVTLEDGSLYTGNIYFFGDRIHSILQPQKLKEFPKLQTTQQFLISCSMISAVLKDEKGNDLYTKYPFKLIEKVPEMIDNQTARQFKKFILDPIDSAWIQKPGLSFNEGNRTFEYEVDTIDSLGPSYMTNLIQRLNNPKKVQLIQENNSIRDSKQQFLQQQQQQLRRQSMIKQVYKDYKNDVKETYFPSCLRSNYVLPSDQQLRELYIFGQRLSYIQIQGKRFYFVSKGYYYGMININYQYKLLRQSRFNSEEYYSHLRSIEIMRQRINACYQKIEEHNMENKSEAESAGQLAIDLEKFTFTRKDISSQMQITAYQFKDLDEEKRQEEKAKKEAEIISQNNIIQFEESISNKISNDLDGKKKQEKNSKKEAEIISFQNKIIKIRIQIEDSISKKVNKYFDETTAQQKLFEKLTLQTVYLPEGHYQNQLMKLLSKYIYLRYNNDYRAQMIVKQNQRQRLLFQLNVMSVMDQQQDISNIYKMNYDDLSACHSRIYEKLYTQQLKAQMIKDVQLNAESQMLQMEKLFQETKDCIIYLEQIRGLRGGGGLDLQVLLNLVGPLKDQYLTEMKKNAQLSLQNIDRLPQNPSSSATITPNQFTKKKAMLQNRSIPLKQLLNRIPNFNLHDDKILQKLFPIPQIEIQFKMVKEINAEANSLINQAVKDIIKSRINKDNVQINTKFNEALNRTPLAQQFKKFNLSTDLLQPHKQLFLNSSQSKLGQDKFGKQCEYSLKRDVQSSFKISLTESKEKNISRLKQNINMMKSSFKNGPKYQIKQQEHIWNYCPEFKNIESFFSSLTRVYYNVDGLTNAVRQWKPPQKPQLFPPYSQSQSKSIKLKESQPLKKNQVKQFLQNSMGGVLKRFEVAIQSSIDQINSDIVKSKKEIVDLDGKIKTRQKSLLENQWRQKLLEDRNTQSKQFGNRKGSLGSLNIQNLRKLEESEKNQVEQNFKSTILPSLENGDVKLNCKNWIQKNMTEIEKDENLHSEAMVDRTFHQDNIKALEKHIQPLQSWIDKSKKLKTKYDTLSIKFGQLQQLQKKYGKYPEHSQKFVQELSEQNKKIEKFAGQMKQYNSDVYSHLKSSLSIDTSLSEIDYNKITITNSSKEIEDIYNQIGNQTEKWKKIIANRERNPAELTQIVRNIQALFIKLNPLQLRSAKSSKAQLNSFIDEFKILIEQIKSGRQINRRQETAIKKNFQKLKSKIYEMKNINKFIDP